MHEDIGDEMIEDLNTLTNPSEAQSDFLANRVKQQVKRATKKMEKVCVAPGESGEFRNWNED